MTDPTQPNPARKVQVDRWQVGTRCVMPAPSFPLLEFALVVYPSRYLVGRHSDPDAGGTGRELFHWVRVGPTRRPPRATLGPSTLEHRATRRKLCFALLCLIKTTSPYNYVRSGAAPNAWLQRPELLHPRL